MSHKKKVIFLHISGYLYPIPRVHIMAEALAKQDYDVTVICVDKDIDSDCYELNNVKIYNINKKIITKSNGYNNIYELLKNIKRAVIEIEPQPDLIQIFSPLLIPLSFYLKTKFGCKLIYDCYEFWLGSALTSRKYHSGLIYLFADLLGSICIDGIIYVYDKNPTRKIFRTIGNNICRKKSKDCVIYNIPDTEIIPKKIEPKCIKIDLFGKDRYFIIGYLGLVMQFKGYETAIKSMAYLDDNFRLLIIGDAIDPCFKEKINDLIAKKKLESKIIFTGIIPHSEALKYTKICDVGLLLFDDTYWTKYSTPNKLFEYMSLGVPIIGTDIPNISYFINKYQCGITLSKNNPEFLAANVREINKKKNILKNYSINGEKAFTNNFTKESQMQKLIELYSDLLQKT